MQWSRRRTIWDALDDIKTHPEGPYSLVAIRDGFFCCCFFFEFSVIFQKKTFFDKTKIWEKSLKNFKSLLVYNLIAYWYTGWFFKRICINIICIFFYLFCSSLFNYFFQNIFFSKQTVLLVKSSWVRVLRAFFWFERRRDQRFRFRLITQWAFLKWTLIFTLFEKEDLLCLKKKTPGKSFYL